MSDLAHYSFLPWLKQGLGSKIAEKEAMGKPMANMAKGRADLQVELTLESSGINDGTLLETEVNKTLKMYGPPDVQAISKDAIVRCEPQPKLNNFESNGLPYIEFYKEDFLWMFTPAVANNERLTPWLALVCLKDDEFSLKKNSEGRAYISIPLNKISNVFHDEMQHWAWAHVHMNTELEATGLYGQIAEVTSELCENPDSGICRLLCPRKLIKETRYTAFLIPTFETGRLAGLGESYTNVLAQKISWGLTEDYASKTRGGDYPIYHSWTFRTGLHGDFESLVRILKPMETCAELGKRNIYIADAGYGLKDYEPNSKVLGIEGALKPPGFESDTWTKGDGDEAYRDHLRKVLNLSMDYRKRQIETNQADSLDKNPFYASPIDEDPVVSPHVYGRWHALANRLQAQSNFPWVNALNLDPRNRSVAALGVKVVQNNQEILIKRAWDQVDEINEANKKIKKAAVSKLIGHALYRKHIANANTDKIISLIGPMHKYILDEDETVEHKITKSFLPNASKSGAFKKIIRPGKKSNRRLNQKATEDQATIHNSIITHFNDGVVRCADEKKEPGLAINYLDVGSAIALSVKSYEESDTAMAQTALFDILLSEPSFADLETEEKKGEIIAKLQVNTNLSLSATKLATKAIEGIISATQGAGGASHVLKIEGNSYKAIFGDEVTAKTYRNIIISRNTEGEVGQIQHATLLHDIQAFSNVFNEFPDHFLSDEQPVNKDKITDLKELSGRISAILDPKELITRRIASSITLKVYNHSTKAYESKNMDRLKPIMAYPKFEDPMFRELKKLSQEYIIPNIEKVPDNSITLLLTNNRFIEAYMSGVNHEMSRELLWREFPTDQRGTYFRQFWDVGDNIFENDREKKYDIKPMHEWKKDLGDHSLEQSNNSGNDTYLVLLIKGELLKKYPNTQVYAQKAIFKNSSNPNTPRTLSDASDNENIKFPVFHAELEPNIYLYGFDLNVKEAKGSSNQEIKEIDNVNDAKPGWFFVFRERPGQVCFGLDDWVPKNQTEPNFPENDPLDWNDLSWEHLVANKSELDSYHINALHSFSTSAGSSNSPKVVWGKNSAHMAGILYQNPVLFARHAQEMLP